MRLKTTALDAIRFRVIPFSERSSEILDLRRKANVATGRLSPRASGERLTDPRDAGASIVIGEDDGRIVASVRVRLPIAGTILHRDLRLEGPLHVLPPKSEFVEISWFCIHPDYHGLGLLWPLTAHQFVAAATFGRPLALAGCEAEMWPIWRRCGYRRIGVFYPAALTGVRCEVVLADLASLLAGRGIGPELASALPRTAGFSHPEPAQLYEECSGG